LPVWTGPSMPATLGPPRVWDHSSDAGSCSPGLPLLRAVPGNFQQTVTIYPPLATKMLSGASGAAGAIQNGQTKVSFCFALGPHR
jgi:hypothetical protein